MKAKEYLKTTKPLLSRPFITFGVFYPHSREIPNIKKNHGIVLKIILKLYSNCLSYSKYSNQFMYFLQYYITLNSPDLGELQEVFIEHLKNVNTDEVSLQPAIEKYYSLKSEEGKCNLFK